MDPLWRKGHFAYNLGDLAIFLKLRFSYLGIFLKIHRPKLIIRMLNKYHRLVCLNISHLGLCFLFLVQIFFFKNCGATLGGHQGHIKLKANLRLESHPQTLGLPCVPMYPLFFRYSYDLKRLAIVNSKRRLYLQEYSVSENEIFPRTLFFCCQNNKLLWICKYLQYFLQKQLPSYL